MSVKENVLEFVSDPLHVSALSMSEDAISTILKGDYAAEKLHDESDLVGNLKDVLIVSDPDWEIQEIVADSIHIINRASNEIQNLKHELESCQRQLHKYKYRSSPLPKANAKYMRQIRLAWMRLRRMRKIAHNAKNDCGLQNRKIAIDCGFDVCDE